MQAKTATGSPARRLLVLDTSYSLEAIQQKQLQYSVLCRDLSGYFDRVWSVHPYATLVTSKSWRPRYGRPELTTLSARHVFIEGKLGRFGGLARWPTLNFIVAQIELLTRLTVLIYRERISVIRAGDPLVLGVYGWLLSRICRIPFAIRVSGNNEKWRQKTGRPVMPRLLRSVRIERAIERFVLPRAHLVAAPNAENLAYAISMGAREERSTVFRYGNLLHPVHFVDPAERPRADELLNELGIAGRRYALYIGRLEPVKMPDHVIRVIAKMRPLCDIALVIVGEGSLTQELRRLAGELGVSDSVIFAGERSQEWLGTMIAHAACVLSPHTGRALTEAALGAAPVVAYDIDWQSEVIRDGVTGALVPVGDVDGMARAASGFVNLQEQARPLGRRLRAAVLEMMNPERLDEHERAQYDRLFERCDRRAQTTAASHSART